MEVAFLNLRYITCIYEACWVFIVIEMSAGAFGVTANIRLYSQWSSVAHSYHTMWDSILREVF